MVFSIKINFISTHPNQVLLGLKEEGLFRVPGLLSDVKDVKAKYDRGTFFVFRGN